MGVLAIRDHPKKLAFMRDAGVLQGRLLGAPFVEGGVAETAFAAQLLDRQACLGLLDEADDLLFGESAFSHVRHSPS